MYKVERAPKEPNAVVIYPPDGSMPAYIPNCADFAFEMLKKLAAQPSVQRIVDVCPEHDEELVDLCYRCGCVASYNR